MTTSEVLIPASAWDIKGYLQVEQEAGGGMHPSLPPQVSSPGRAALSDGSSDTPLLPGSGRLPEAWPNPRPRPQRRLHHSNK